MNTNTEMKLYLIRDYRSLRQDLSGKELTDHLVRRILMRLGETDPVVMRTPKGKPYLAGNSPFISVSHTDRLFGCLVAERNAGLDLQYRRDLDCEKLSRRFFSAEEQRIVSEQGADGFFRLWSRKEALCKYTGRGLEEILAGEPVLGREDVVFSEFCPADGLYGCVCADAEAGAPRITIIRLTTGEDDEDLFSDGK